MKTTPHTHRITLPAFAAAFILAFGLAADPATGATSVSPVQSAVQAAGVQNSVAALAKDVKNLVLLPVFTTQPKGQTLDPQYTAYLGVRVTSTTSLTLQWKYSQDNGVTFKNVPADWPVQSGKLNTPDGASWYSNLETCPLEPSMNGMLIRCVATNSGGSVNSDSAKITVNPATPKGYSSTITKNPVSQTLPAGATAVFAIAVTTNDPAPIYRWQKLTPGATLWTDIPGANTITLVIPNVTYALNGTQYHCLVGDSSRTTGPGSFITSYPATLTVK